MSPSCFHRCYQKNCQEREPWHALGFRALFRIVLPFRLVGRMISKLVNTYFIVLKLFNLSNYLINLNYFKVYYFRYIIYSFIHYLIKWLNLYFASSWLWTGSYCSYFDMPVVSSCLIPTHLVLLSALLKPLDQPFPTWHRVQVVLSGLWAFSCWWDLGLTSILLSLRVWSLISRCHNLPKDRSAERQLGSQSIC